MARFTVKPDATFKITIPVDVSRPEAPRIIFAEAVEHYPEILRNISAEAIEYHSCVFKRPSWGEDCLVRELAYTGDSVSNRQFSRERFDEARIKHFLRETTLLDTPLSFINGGQAGDVLSTVAEGNVKQIIPSFLHAFLLIAGSIWDMGGDPNNLLSADDYKLLREDPKGLEKVLEQKGILKAQKIAEDKKKSLFEPEKPSGVVNSPPTLATSLSSSDQQESSGKTGASPSLNPQG